MKNVIKKTCAIVMMTAVLFTSVAPTPVFATCPHPHPPVTNTVEEYYTSTTHKVNGKSCTVYIYKVYRVSKCADCGNVFNKQLTGTTEKHSVKH